MSAHINRHRRVSALERRAYGGSIPGGFTYHDQCAVDWLGTLDDDNFELVGQVIEHEVEAGERPDLDPERLARYEALDREVRQYLRERGVVGF